MCEYKFQKSVHFRFSCVHLYDIIRIQRTCIEYTIVYIMCTRTQKRIQNVSDASCFKTNFDTKAKYISCIIIFRRISYTNITIIGQLFM